jgi:hypothetical protein
MLVQTTVASAPSLMKTLFDSETGMINPRFKRQLEIVGIAVKQHFSDFDSYHIRNVNEELQTNGCFQKDCDLYKKGSSSAFKIDYQQAVKFLEDEYQDRETIMPREKKMANAIFPCGVEATMHKRFNSLIESLKQGYQYDTIHFIVKDNVDKENVSKLINTTYNELVKGIKINIIVADTDLDIFEKGLKQLKEASALSKEYVIITDPTFASKVELIASSVLNEHTCMGIASAPIKDWKVDMNLYGYESSLGSHEKAAIAWASSAWNFKARQVNTEFKNFVNKVTAL